jgi:hypothetical protein
MSARKRSTIASVLSLDASSTTIQRSGGSVCASSDLQIRPMNAAPTCAAVMREVDVGPPDVQLIEEHG